MKKVININLSGRVIPIEDSAYDILKEYTEKLKDYFSKEESRDEIINDIESRISELMNDRISKGGSCVTESDIQDIISIMGLPEDLEKEEIVDNDSKSESGYDTNKKGKGRFRLYRDLNDKIIGGVCSGISNYLNIDPSITRVIFAIMILNGWGILIYLLLWLILPASALSDYHGKKFFRNNENKILGGVCSGLGAYFGKSPALFRFLFALPIIINIFSGLFTFPFGEFFLFPNIFFGSLTGTFVITYIILWIILPKAKTPYQKMEMRGETVNIDSIKKTVKNEYADLKTKLKNMKEDTKISSSSKSTFINAIGILVKALAIMLLGVVALISFSILSGLLFGGYLFFPLTEYLFSSYGQHILGWIVLILFLALPLVSFITLVIRRLAKTRSKNHYLAWTFGGLWVIGLLAAVFLVAGILKDFRKHEVVDVPVKIEQPSNGKYILKVDDPIFYFQNIFDWVDSDVHGFDIQRDSLVYSLVKVNIVKSRDTSFRAVVSRYSAGLNSVKAVKRARNIGYDIGVENGIINLSNGLAVSNKDKFRAQRIVVNVHIPEGKMIRFDRTMKYADMEVMTRSYHEFENYKKRWHKDWNGHHEIYWESSTDYVMTEDGNIKKLNGNEYEEEINGDIENDKKYRYRKSKKRGNITHSKGSKKSTDYEESSDVNFAGIIFSKFM